MEGKGSGRKGQKKEREWEERGPGGIEKGKKLNGRKGVGEGGRRKRKEIQGKMKVVKEKMYESYLLPPSTLLKRNLLRSCMNLVLVSPVQPGATDEEKFYQHHF